MGKHRAKVFVDKSVYLQYSMDVVSLAPSATETIVELGAGDHLVATVETRNPPEHADIVGGWLTSPAEATAQYDPDLVITTDALQEEQRDALAGELPTLHLDPRTLDDVVDSIQRIAEALDRESEGRRLGAEFTQTLSQLSTTELDSHPVVYCEEWSSPPMVSGNWIPDVVSAAGGKYPFTSSTERSRTISQAEFERYNPDIVILNICGQGDSATSKRILERGWNANAIPEHIHVVDDVLLNQPSPHLLGGIERLNEIITAWDEEHT